MKKSFFTYLILVLITNCIINKSFCQKIEFDLPVTLFGSTPMLSLHDTAPAEDRIEFILQEFLDDILLSTLRGDLYLKTSKTVNPVTALFLSGTNQNIGVGTISPSGRMDITHNSGISSAHLELDETTLDDFARIKFHNSTSQGNDFWDIAVRAAGPTDLLGSGSAPPAINFYYDNGSEAFDYVQILPVRLQNIFPPNNIINYADVKVMGNVLPKYDNGGSLGDNDNRWTWIWSLDGTINTSDARLKKNIKSSKYGLNEIRKLNPVTFNWKNDISEAPQLGLLAQEVLKLIPEAVVTKEIIKDNLGNQISKPVENLGLKYDVLIPVLIKSIQEQQELIDNLSQEVENLKKLLEK